MGVNIGKPDVDFRNSCGVFCGLGLGEQGRAFGVSRQNRVNEALGASWRFLRHRADPKPARKLDFAGFRPYFAPYQSEKGCFPCSVTTHKADARAGRNGR